VYVNSWGDAIVAAFNVASQAAQAALDLRDLFRNTNWNNLGLPNELAARIGLHAGSVFIGDDPLQGRLGLAGHNVNLAARIEPIAQPNEVWLSETMARLLQEESNDKIKHDDLGERPLAKQWGSRKIFRLRRAHEPADTQISDLEKVASQNPTDRKLQLALRLLTHGLTEEDKIAAVKMLAQLPGEDQLGEIIAIARNKQLSQKLRNTAIGSFGWKSSPQVSEILIAIIEDEGEDLDIRDTALVILGHVGGSGARETLLKAVKDDEFPAITRARAVHSLGALSDWSVYPEIEALIEQQRAERQLEAEFALGFIGFCRLFDDSRCLPTLVSLATDENVSEPVRVESLQAILFIGAPWLHKDSIAKLIEFAKKRVASKVVSDMVLATLARTTAPEATGLIDAVASDLSNPSANIALALLVNPNGVTFPGDEPRPGERGYDEDA
jgi:HEAT repeat protein